VLTIKTQCNLSNAEKYFEEHLQLGDYYSQENQVFGEWVGNGAELLGLEGVVKEADFLKLCRNEHPDGDGTLTQRLKTTRWDEGQMAEVANRRVFYDFTFSPPKSVSIQAFIAEDRRILDAHNRAIRIAAKELECFAGTRVHHGQRISERLVPDTGWTSRFPNANQILVVACQCWQECYSRRRQRLAPVAQMDRATAS
jgi:conjugative relaxase-like TrwC/TraI family protein